jgi:hypothetical protein
MFIGVFFGNGDGRGREIGRRRGSGREKVGHAVGRNFLYGIGRAVR